MMLRKSVIILILALLPVVGFAKRFSFVQLRQMAAAGEPVVTDMYTNMVPSNVPLTRYETKINDKLYLSGYVVGSPNYPFHANLEIPFQSSFYDVSVSYCMKVVYMESEDGKYGVQLVFPNEKIAGKMTLYSFAEVNLKGATLIKEGNRYIVKGLKEENINFVEPGTIESIPKKEKYISELTDDDIFTFVTLKECEFAVKNGCFGNMDEGHITKSIAGRNLGRGHADGWEKLIVDSRGDRIYMHVNCKMTDRHIGGGIPQGTGSICGIIVDTYNPRYGDTHSYGIRPGCPKHIFFEWLGDPGYKTIAAWDWMTKSTGMIPAEYGAGLMGVDVPGAEVGRFYDFDNPVIELNSEHRANSLGKEGKVDDGAMQIVARSCDWWNWDRDEGRSLILKVSTSGCKGRQMLVMFSFCGGAMSSTTSAGYPSYWNVSWSLDGVNFTKSDSPDATMRSLPFPFYGSKGQEVDGYHYEMSSESGLGYTEHCFALPGDLLGKGYLYIKISPSNRTMASLAYMDIDNMRICPESESKCYVNFGEVIVAYR